MCILYVLIWTAFDSIEIPPTRQSHWGGCRQQAQQTGLADMWPFFSSMAIKIWKTYNTSHEFITWCSLMWDGENMTIFEKGHTMLLCFLGHSNLKLKGLMFARIARCAHVFARNLSLPCGRPDTCGCFQIGSCFYQLLFAYSYSGFICKYHDLMTCFEYFFVLVWVNDHQVCEYIPLFFHLRTFPFLTDLTQCGAFWRKRKT